MPITSATSHSGQTRAPEAQVKPSGCRSSTIPRPERQGTAGACSASHRTVIDSEACRAPPPTNTIGARAACSSLAASSILSRSGAGGGAGGIGACGRTGASR